MFDCYAVTYESFPPIFNFTTRHGQGYMAFALAPVTVVSASVEPTLYRQPPVEFWQLTMRPTAFFKAGPTRGSWSSARPA